MKKVLLLLLLASCTNRKAAVEKQLTEVQDYMRDKHDQKAALMIKYEALAGDGSDLGNPNLQAKIAVLKKSIDSLDNLKNSRMDEYYSLRVLLKKY